MGQKTVILKYVSCADPEINVGGGGGAPYIDEGSKVRLHDMLIS